MISAKDRKDATRQFVERWRGRGNEDQDTQAFWTDFLISAMRVPPPAYLHT